jgi:hypothetical protein
MSRTFLSRCYVRATLATLCATLAAVVVSSAPALALKTHVFASSFGGSGSSSLSDPQGLAIDQGTGEVYVVDSAHDRVEIFNASGAFVSAFGTAGSGSGQFIAPTQVAVENSGPLPGDVYVLDQFNNRVESFNAKGEYQSQITKADLAATGAEAGSFRGVAVDAGGNLWIYDSASNMYKFPSGGALPGSFSFHAEREGEPGLAIDSNGDFYVLGAPRQSALSSPFVQKLDPSGNELGEVDACGCATAVAVDPVSEDLYVDHGTSVAHFLASNSSGTPNDSFGSSGPSALIQGSGIAVKGSTGSLYVADATRNSVDIFDTATLPDVSIEPVSSLQATSVTLNGMVNPDGAPVSSCEFEYGPTAAYGQRAPCTQTPAQIGGASSPVPVSASLTGLQPGSAYHYRLDAGNASGTNDGQDQTLTTSGALVDSESTSNVASTSATLQAQINPTGRDTVYYFQYGTSSSYGVSVPAPPGADIGSGSSDQAVRQAISALAPSTSYHYRVVAVNAFATSDGPDQVFDTNATPAAPPIYSSSPGLPDGRVYEQVSPADKNGNAAGAGTGVIQFAPEAQYSVASPDGNAVLFWASGAMGNASNGLAEYFVARRSAAGWTTTEATPRQTSGEISAFSTPSTMLSSSDLSHVVFEESSRDGGFGFAGIGPESGSQIYLAGLDPLAQPAWLSQPTIPAPIQSSSLVIKLAGASPDLGTVYFGYDGTLLPQDASRTPYTRTRSFFLDAHNAAGFYEWKNGALLPAGVLPDGSIDPFGAVPAADAQAYNGTYASVTAEDLNNQVSTDGSHAFFVSPDPSFCSQNLPICGGDQPELYARVTAADGTRSTVLVSKSAITGQPAPHGPLQMQNPHGVFTRNVHGGAHGIAKAGSRTNALGTAQPYVYASPDGSQAFFESIDQLTSDAPNDSSVKEYDFNLASGSLTYLPSVADLSPESAPAEVHGPLASSLSPAPGTSPILVSSQDGSDFIFVRYPPGGIPQLDLWRSGSSGGTVTPISQLPPSPAHEGQYSENPKYFSNFPAPKLGGMAFAAARATADGSVFVFETDSPLPGFNNAPGYAEIYRYDTVAKALSCVSCPPAGPTPSGDAQIAENDLISPFPTELYGWLNAARGMSADDGRIFFDTPDSLVAQDTNGVDDVYEWDNGRIDLLSSGTSVNDSLILDSSLSGNDVFFATTDGLVAGDTDGAYDVYDARVPRPGDVPLSSAVPCQGDVCQGPPRVPSLLGTSPSETFSGPGNPTPLPATKTATHKQVKKKPKKAKKHKQKRKRGSTRSKRGRK